MDSSPDKPEYFANGDFEDAVSSIIASPRRGIYFIYALKRATEKDVVRKMSRVITLL